MYQTYHKSKALYFKILFLNHAGQPRDRKQESNLQVNLQNLTVVIVF